MSGREAVIGYGLAALLLLSTLGEGGGSPSVLAAWHAALALLLSGALAFPALAERPGTVRGAGAFAFAGFLVAVGIGAARAPYGYGAWLVCLELACWVAVLALAVRLGPALVGRLAPVLLAAAALEGCLAIVQSSRPGAGRPAATFLNPNHMALWLVAALLVALGACRGWTRTRRRLAAAAAAPAIAALVLAGSRGALLAAVVGGSWLAAVHWGGIPPRVRRAAVLGGLVLAAALGVGLALRAREFDPFRHHRLQIWRNSLRAVGDDPLWGSGPGQFATAAANLQFPDGEGPLRYDHRYSTPHSDLVRAAAEFGLPAAVALAAAIGLAAVRIARRRSRGETPRGADGAVAALLAIGAQGLVDDPSAWPALYLLAAALLGALLSEAGATTRPVPVRARAALAALVAIVFVVTDFSPYLAWRGTRTLPRGRLDAAELARLERSARQNRAQASFPLRLAEHLASDPEPWTPAAYVRAREWAERALALSPNDADARRGVARVEARICREWQPLAACRERVLRLYESAADAARSDPAIPLELARFLLDTGDPTAARRAAERALGIEPEAALPRLLLAAALLETGGPDGRSRARELVSEAENRARRFAAASREPYGRMLLSITPEVRSRIEKLLAEAAVRGSDPPGPR